MSALQKNKSFDFLKQNAIYFVLLILLGIIIAQDPTFLNVRNFSNILTQSSVRLIIALGVAGFNRLSERFSYRLSQCNPVHCNHGYHDHRLRFQLTLL